MDYLRSDLVLYYYNPGTALWRAIEHQLLHETFTGLGLLQRPIVDIGCGDGQFFSVLCKNFPWTIDVGVDLYVPAVCQARTSQAYRHAVAGDGRKLALRDGSVGTVLSNSVFEHIPGVESVINEAYRVLRPGGMMFATVVTSHYGALLLWCRIMTAVGFVRWAKNYSVWKNARYGHHSLMSIPEWQDQLARSGFEVVSVRPYLASAAVAACDVFHELALLGAGPFRLRSLIYRLPFAKRLVPAIFGRALRRPYDASLTAGNSKGACALIVVRKPV